MDAPTKTQVENHRGRKCVVIGASYGVGRRTADVLASRGALVVYASGSRRGLSDCIQGEGKEYCSALVVDASDPESVRDGMADAARELGGSIDLVVYCPEHGDPDDLRSFEREFDAGDWDSGWERYMNVHINGMMNSFRHTKDALLRSTRGGVFVGLSCAAESVCHPEPRRYGIFKAAVDMTLGQLSREYAPRGLRFFSIAPSGLPYTLATDGVGSPARKMRRSPSKDVGELIAFLTSKQDSFATGAPIHSDFCDTGLSRPIEAVVPEVESAYANRHARKSKHITNQHTGTDPEHSIAKGLNLHCCMDPGLKRTKNESCSSLMKNLFQNKTSIPNKSASTTGKNGPFRMTSKSIKDTPRFQLLRQALQTTRESEDGVPAMTRDSLTTLSSNFSTCTRLSSGVLDMSSMKKPRTSPQRNAEWAIME